MATRTGWKPTPGWLAHTPTPDELELQARLIREHVAERRRVVEAMAPSSERRRRLRNLDSAEGVAAAREAEAEELRRAQV